MEEQWINDLRKKMASHQTPVPPGLWEGIESAIGQPPKSVMPLRKKVLLWTSGIGGIAAAVALVFFFLTGTAESPESPAMAELATEPVTPELMSKQGLSTKLLAYQSPNADKEKLSGQIAGHVNVLPTAKDKERKKEELPNAVAEVKRESADNGRKSAEPERKKHHITKERVNALMTRQNDRKVSSSVLQTKTAPLKKNPVKLQLFAGNLLHTSHHNTGYGEFVAGTVMPHQMSGRQPETMEPVKDIIYSNLGKEVETRKKHKTPLKAGLSVRYYLSPRFSLETGLTYSFLASELSSGTDRSYFVTKQKLHYLGIPLSVNYDIWKNKSWDLYAAVGGAMEKCIRGKSDTDYILEELNIGQKESHVMDKPLQWSVNGAVGIQLSLTSHMGMYLEPGVNYYFDNGSPVENIYKEQPFNFNFKLGFRFTMP